jgi:hypothetical protein
MLPMQVAAHAAHTQMMADGKDTHLPMMTQSPLSITTCGCRYGSNNQSAN